MMTSVDAQLKLLAEQSGFEVLDEASLAGRRAKYVPVPGDVHPEIRTVLNRDYPSGLYSHQAQGIQLVLDGYDVCLATPTASGKSLVFMTVTADRLKRNPSAKALALYPAKALIQDQLAKWKRALEPLDLTPGYIDGAVPTEARPSILKKNRVVLMTPDVAHAWFMSHLQQKEVRNFLSGFRFLILDEAHVYDGVFGTNMAYFIRRLEAVSGLERVISSTATIGEPGAFVERLTGRRPHVLTQKDDRTATSSKTITLARAIGGNPFERLVDIVLNLARSGIGRFLAFGDSRKMVEQLVAIAERSASKGSEKPDNEPGVEDTKAEEHLPPSAQLRILPYRAGYEEEDRKDIQNSLMRGDLAGVISTSALELGLDIGEIDIILLLNTPPSVKAFWQRFGRGGRKNNGSCLLVDDRGIIASSPTGLHGYLQRPPERGWLYLDNQYIQYSHALCAAVEASEASVNQYTKVPFESLPMEFGKFLDNELNPTESVSDELYHLKQRAQAGPHYEFPLRSGIEKTFNVRERGGPIDVRLGTLSYSQALREAYPGAIYYYMARPYRAYQFNYRTGEIRVRKEKRWTTKPTVQNMVFPKFQGGVLTFLGSDAGFIVEAELQVSERVLGFTEQRGPNKVANPYEPGSPYAQRPVNRFFETTGVCWYFQSRAIMSESLAQWVLGAFCIVCGIQKRDLGIGTFHAKPSSVWDEQCQGMCIYDAVHGSLRLTKQLAMRFVEVLDTAILIAQTLEHSDTALESNLALLKELVRETSPSAVSATEHPTESQEDWVSVIAPGQKAMHLDEAGTKEVEVVTYRYTPQGLMYQLVSPRPGVTWLVKASTVIPVHGETKLLETNLVTGETRPVT
jgi:DEAD/DEAH box helicase domain-containing protein